MADQTVTQTSVTDIPDWMKQYMAGDDTGSYTGILPEVMRLYQNRSGGMTDAEQQALTMPDEQVAGFNPTQLGAMARVRAGLGSYQPMLQAASGSVASGIGNMQSGFNTLQGGVNRLGVGERMTQDAVRQGQLAAAGGVQGIANAANQGVLTGNRTARNIMGQIGTGQRALTGSAGDIQNIGALSQRVGATTGQNLLGRGSQAQRVGANTARNILSAGSSADAMGRFGLNAARSGIQSLQGSSAEFDPSSIQGFMNPYEQSVIDAAMADVARAGQQQQNALGATAVGAGAFGGSRQGIQAAEIGRNTLEQQAKTAAGLRQAGYESASQRAQNAYEAARARQQSGAQIQGQLGQAGAATGLNAAQTSMAAAGQAGQAQQQGLAQGLAAAGQAGQAQQQGLAQGLAAAGQAGAMGAQAAQMGMQGAQNAGAAQMQGLQMGMQGAQQAGAMGMQGAQMGMQGAGQMGAFAGQYGQLGQGMSGIGQGIVGAGMQQAKLGEAAQGLQANDINALMQVGGMEQGLRQDQMNAAYNNQMARYNQPQRDLGFFSDVFQGMPTGQQSYTQKTSPGPSRLSQGLGLATGLYGMSQG